MVKHSKKKLGEKNNSEFVFKYGSIYNEDIAKGSRHLKKASVEVDIIIAEINFLKKYNSSSNLSNGNNNNNKNNNNKTENNEKRELKELTLLINSAVSLLKNGGSALFFCPYNLISAVIKIAPKANLQYKNIIIFEDLSKSKLAGNFFTSDINIILWLCKKGGKPYFNSAKMPYISPVIKSSFDADFDKYEEKIVLTQKPIKVYERLLQWFSKINDTVLLPNAAGGTGVIAALHLKRNWLAFVSSAKEFSKTKDRIDKFKNINN
ncbi:MAG: site-specific DNA-methyltransferase [Bifidobacteriaceae bacterium]|jgi:DNA modification methylase|nr:site-specific DNA-methyltransferase [Bifidobacteriaceae bacterium]